VRETATKLHSYNILLALTCVLMMLSGRQVHQGGMPRLQQACRACAGLSSPNQVPIKTQ
jgi:hypothetical protein